MFSSLETLFGGSGGLDGLSVLDLYAGSGALGLEAVSRGAANVTFVEADARAVRTIRANVAAVGLPGTTVVHNAVERVLTARQDGPGPYDLVMADPPYSMAATELGAVLARLGSGWLAPEAVVVVERDRRSEPIRWPDGLAGLRERAYGETVLWYGHVARTAKKAE